jgi:hypothetical protein
MKTYPNGHRYKYTKLYDDALNQPYDYSDDGLLQHLMSARVTSTPNQITKFIVGVFEKSVCMLLRLTDVLANFKNPYFRNR